MKIKSFLAISLAFFMLVSCGKGNNQETEEQIPEQTEEQEGVQPLSKTINVYSGEAVTGDEADYLMIDMPAGEAIQLKAEPGEGYSSPKFRVQVPVQVTKKFPKEISYLRISLELMDENNEYVTSLSINDADKETLIAALNKGKGDVINIGFNTTVFKSNYNKDFDKVKYYRIKDLDISESSTTATKVSKSSSYEDDDDSGSSYASSAADDDDDNGEKKDSKWKKAKNAVKNQYEKAKETYNDKYKDKVDDAKEKIKDKFHDIFN